MAASARVASADIQTRVFAYSLVSVPLFRLPNDEFLDEIKSVDFAGALAEIESGFRSEAMATGISSIREYVSDACIESLPDLARDRTYLLRALAPGVGAPPPYESFWRRSGSSETTMAALSDLYRQSDLDVAPSAHERVDYLGVELMFMMRLIASEADAGAGELEAIRAQETRFFFEHLDPWVAEYVRAALPHAKTGFFGGLLQVLLALVEADAAYLRADAA